MTKQRVSEAAWKEGLYDSFEKVRSHTIPYEVTVGKFDILVLPSVFSPKYFTDSLWFAERLPAIVRDASFLEIGCGTGIVSLYCAAAGAEVTATDINRQAVINTIRNAKKVGFPIAVREGDLFKALFPREKFDFMFWNHPFNSWADHEPDVLLRAGIDPDYRDLRRYMLHGRRHLTGRGAQLLGSSDMAEVEKLRRIAHACACKLTVLEQGDMPIEDGSDVWNTYYIYRIDPH